MAPDANLMSMNAQPTLVSTVEPARTASVTLCASAKMVTKAKGARKKSTCASQIHASMVGSAKLISTHTLVNANLVLKAKTARSTLMIAC